MNDVTQELLLGLSETSLLLVLGKTVLLYIFFTGLAEKSTLNVYSVKFQHFGKDYTHLSTFHDFTTFHTFCFMIVQGIVSLHTVGTPPFAVLFNWRVHSSIYTFRPLAGYKHARISPRPWVHCDKAPRRRQEYCSCQTNFQTLFRNLIKTLFVV